MNKNIFFKKYNQMKSITYPQCHDGKGRIILKEVLSKEEKQQRSLEFLHDDIIPPGSTIGIHTHKNEEEYYYILSGKGTMTLNEQIIPVQQGDLAAVFPGGSHGIENPFEEELHILVICIKTQNSLKK